MIGVIGLIVILTGATTACTGERFPKHVEMLETVAGVLLLGGLALCGTSLPAIL